MKRLKEVPQTLLGPPSSSSPSRRTPQSAAITGTHNWRDGFASPPESWCCRTSRRSSQSESHSRGRDPSYSKAQRCIWIPRNLHPYKSKLQCGMKKRVDSLTVLFPISFTVRIVLWKKEAISASAYLIRKNTHRRNPSPGQIPRLVWKFSVASEPQGQMHIDTVRRRLHEYTRFLTQLSTEMEASRRKR